MPRFSANISLLFTEVPVIERIAMAREAGFDAIEIQFPYSCNLNDFAAAMADSQLPLALMNCPAGDFMSGGQGNAAVPGRESEFSHAVEQAREWGRVLRPEAINVLAGRPEPVLDRADCMAVLEANMSRAFEAFNPLGIRLLTEAINTVDMPGFFLSQSQQVLDLITRLPAIELYLQYDIYHMHRMGELSVQRLQQIMPLIGHIQFADAPGRMEPGTGEIDFTALFDAIDSSQYQGFVGAEYRPAGSTVGSLDWLKA